jgi:hypothetical protein
MTSNIHLKSRQDKERLLSKFQRDGLVLFNKVSQKPIAYFSFLRKVVVCNTNYLKPNFVTSTQVGACNILKPPLVWLRRSNVASPVSWWRHQRTSRLR